MASRVLSWFLLAVALAVFSGAPVLAEEVKDKDKDKKADKEKDKKADKNTHEGTFVKASGDNEFAMEDKDGKEHKHTLAKDAKVTGEDGKEAKLSDFKKGQKIRVTTKEDDNKVATKVEAVKEKDKKEKDKKEKDN